MASRRTRSTRFSRAARLGRPRGPLTRGYNTLDRGRIRNRAQSSGNGRRRRRTAALGHQRPQATGRNHVVGPLVCQRPQATGRNPVVGPLGPQRPQATGRRPVRVGGLAPARVGPRRRFASRMTRRSGLTRPAVEFTTLDITMAQAKLLYVVATASELSMSEIALRLGVTVSTSSGAVDRLVELGLLARSDDPSNRRQVRVSVTEMGTRTLEQVRELSVRQLRTLFELVSDEDLAVIERATRILADATSAAASSTTGGGSQPIGSPFASPAGSRRS
jgi:DNA-binding MarR family transcriptional regulator